MDYAAPTGTPVRAAGAGRVQSRGRSGGYGNAIVLEHGGGVTTLYGHLSRFARGVAQGSRVRQGQVIGYVGGTGLATAAPALRISDQWRASQSANREIAGCDTDRR